MQKAATGKALVVLDSTLNSQLIREVNPSATRYEAKGLLSFNTVDLPRSGPL